MIKLNKKNKIIIFLLFINFIILSKDYYPSPSDWRKIVIYFLIIDRFANGNKDNDNFGKGEYNPEDVDFYHGGDIKGIIEKLDYIKNLGCSAIWISPPVKNQWISPNYGKGKKVIRFAGYHGYWAHDFYSIDPHFGTFDDYKLLIFEAHKRGIYVIQDIVCNHMGDFVSSDGTKKLDGYPDFPASPFSDNSLESKIFNFNGKTRFDKEFSGLDDLNTENQYVIDNLINIYKFWIKEFDIDGYRIDTVSYIKMDFWKKFCLEIINYAKSIGKKNFILFGEDFQYELLNNKKFDEVDKILGEYTQNNIFNSMLNFSFCGAITSVFAGSLISGPYINSKPNYGSFNELANRFSKNILDLYSNESKYQLVNFIDNHDMTRFLHSSKLNNDLELLKISLGALLSLPGIPCIYYGTEQGFNQPPAKKGYIMGSNNRQNMWDSEYKIDTDIYKFIQKINFLREQHSELWEGEFIPLIVDGNNGAIFVYKRKKDDNNEIYIIINRSNKNQKINLKINKVTIDLLNPEKKYNLQKDIIISKKNILFLK